MVCTPESECYYYHHLIQSQICQLRLFLDPPLSADRRKLDSSTSRQNAFVCYWYRANINKAIIINPAAITEDFIILLLVKLEPLYSRFTIWVCSSGKVAQQIIKDSAKED
jgi:hypothetical protein